MADGKPKNYSSMYREDKPPIPSIRIRPYKSLDGSHAPPKHHEQLDLRKVVAKLQNLPRANHSAYAMDTLNKHYSSVFVNRKSSFKAYIKYFDEKETYQVTIATNCLRAVKDKMPKKGDYRYFFRGEENVWEEIESDESQVPYEEKGNAKQIICQVFLVNN